MKPSFSSSSSSSDASAALWAARLDGSELSASDRTELEQWLAADPTHRTLLSSYCQFSADLEQPLQHLAEVGAISLPAPAPVVNRATRWKQFTAGALVAAAAAFAVIIAVKQPAPELTAMTTAFAQRQSLTLSDGTVVELNAQTRLEISMSHSERRVRLVTGEAFFQVAPNAARPFVIETRAGSIRVTGTSFSVRTEGAAALEVTVVQGSVQVRTGDLNSANSAPVLLEAGQKLSRSPEGVSIKILSSTALDEAMAWRRGQIILEGVPLREALAQFARYHGRSMTVSEGAAQLPLGGRYSLDDLRGFFAALVELFPVKVITEVDGTVRVSHRDEP